MGAPDTSEDVVTPIQAATEALKSHKEEPEAVFTKEPEIEEGTPSKEPVTV